MTVSEAIKTKHNCIYCGQTFATPQERFEHECNVHLHVNPDDYRKFRKIQNELVNAYKTYNAAKTVYKDTKQWSDRFIKKHPELCGPKIAQYEMLLSQTTDD